MEPDTSTRITSAASTLVDGSPLPTAEMLMMAFTSVPPRGRYST